MDPVRTEVPAMTSAVVSTVCTAALAATPLARVTVFSQTVIANTVTIGEVVLPSSGFLAIQSGDEQGSASSTVIGGIPLSASFHESVKMPLSGPPKKGEKLSAVLHSDTGKKGKFEFAQPGYEKVDMPFKADGEPVEMALLLE